MTWFHPGSVEGERQRWMRPDAARFIRPDWRRYVKPGHEHDHPFALIERKAGLKRARPPDRDARQVQHEKQVHEAAILRLQWRAAAIRFELALRRHDRALKYGFNPNQPRVPAGNPDGGEWTSEGISEGPQRVRLAGNIPTGEPPEIPRQRPRRPRDRTAILKVVARRILENAETLLAVAKTSAWLLSYAPIVESYNDPPRSLEELQEADSSRAFGYDVHHIVQRNQEYKFGKELINSPENLVRIPRMKHWDINSWYETENPEFGGQSPREYLNGRSWAVQRSVGLEALKKAGVLKP